MNPISNERQVSPLGNTGDVAGLVPVTQPRSETRLDAATVQVAGQARKSGVSLNPPLAVSNSQVSAQQLGEIGKLVASVKENTRLILPHTTGLVTAAFTSPEAFEIELGKLTSDLEKTQTKLKLDDIRQARTLNEKKIGENQAKIKEAEESAQEAKKAGILWQNFWLDQCHRLAGDRCHHGGNRDWCCRRCPDDRSWRRWRGQHGCAAGCR